jgi:hypothetical protein
MSRFEDAVTRFTGILRRCHEPGLNAAEAMSQFYGWMGQVQRLLSLANQELTQQLAELRTQGGDTLQAVQEFADYQASLAEGLDEITAILRDCPNVHALLDAEGRLQQALAKVESAGDQLDAMLEDDEDPGPGPLPEPVAHCLDSLETAMTHMVRYSEERHHQDLLDLARELDRARAALQQHLDAS